MDWRFAIVSQPHQITIDEDGKVVAIVVAGPSVADEGGWHELCRGSWKAIERSRDSERAIGVEDLAMFGHDALRTGVACDMCDKHGFVF